MGEHKLMNEGEEGKDVQENEEGEHDGTKMGRGDFS